MTAYFESLDASLQRLVTAADLPLPAGFAATAAAFAELSKDGSYERAVRVVPTFVAAAVTADKEATLPDRKHMISAISRYTDIAIIPPHPLPDGRMAHAEVRQDGSQTWSHEYCLPLTADFQSYVLIVFKDQVGPKRSGRPYQHGKLLAAAILDRRDLGFLWPLAASFGALNRQRLASNYTWPKLITNPMGTRLEFQSGVNQMGDYYSSQTVACQLEQGHPANTGSVGGFFLTQLEDRMIR